MFRLAHLLFNSRKAEKHPIEVMLLAFFYASISLFLSIWIFPDYASIVMVFLTTISCLYIAQNALILEETKEEDAEPESLTLKKHKKIMILFMSLFFGFLIAYIFWIITLPSHLSILTFNTQESAVRNILTVTGSSISKSTSLKLIISNNFRVMFLALIFSLIYGAGAIFILAWNASVMGFVMGSLAKNSLGLSSLPHITLKYFLHGIPEILAYFTAALAGGILFVTFIRSDFKEGKIKRTLADTTLLVVLSSLLIIFSALIEVYISSSI